jgi:hypothetical protein
MVEKIVKEEPTSLLTFVTLENVLAAVVADSRVGWDCRTTSRTLQALRHARDGFVEIFVLEHQI